MKALESAYILHIRDYRESSALVDVLTQQEGRFSLVAKGVKSTRRNQKSHLQCFRKLAISWAGRSDLKTLTSAEEQAVPLKLSETPLLAGFYVNELLTRLLQPFDPHPEIFEIYEQVLSALAEPQPIEQTLRLFEKNLLEALGYGMQLTIDISGNEIDSVKNYCYLLESGPRPVEPGQSQGVIVSGKTLLSMHAGCLDSAESLKESKRLMRYLLSPYIGHRPLKTRELFNYY